MFNTIEYVKGRLSERSTLLAIGAAVGAASSFPHPYSWIVIGFSSAAALVPDGSHPLAPKGGK
jgi:hypothetical protein